ncbi:MAG: hypothetical protein KGJ68_00565 [Gammaproteobacteria bacterium]|nr:hypothetical protein [Gammaproteobacteria bacterium]
MLFLATAFSGWAAALLLAAGICVPYAVRALKGTSLAPHYFIGLALPAAALLHAWLPMASIPIRRFDRTGLSIATVAFALLIAQAALGLALRASAAPRRGRLRHVHLVSMMLLVLLVAGHIVRSR